MQTPHCPCKLSPAVFLVLTWRRLAVKTCIGPSHNTKLLGYDRQPSLMASRPSWTQLIIQGYGDISCPLHDQVLDSIGRSFSVSFRLSFPAEGRKQLALPGHCCNGWLVRLWCLLGMSVLQTDSTRLRFHWLLGCLDGSGPGKEDNLPILGT